MEGPGRLEGRRDVICGVQLVAVVIWIKAGREAESLG